MFQKKGGASMAKFYYGGQAVIEGVMMRGQKSVAVAIRRPDKTIYLHEEALNSRLYQSNFFRLPFVRGVRLLWEMLVLGTRLMTFSANIASGAVDPEGSSTNRDTRTTFPETSSVMSPNIFADTSLQEKPEVPPQIGGAALAFSLVISLGFAVVVFFLGPLFIASLFRGLIGTGIVSLIVEGIIRLALLIGYLYAIGQVPDIQRVFGYHGAEHKAINCMEHGQPLDVSHVRLASRVHTRCGTGFLLIVMVVSIVVFALVGSPSLLIKVLSRILLIPVVAAIAYELMRLGAANYRFRLVRWLLAPGLALQGLTTREPDDTMIECAIASLKRVMQRDGTNVAEPGSSEDALPPFPI
jgi:uncharacterized protein YqhQ